MLREMGFAAAVLAMCGVNAAARAGGEIYAEPGMAGAPAAGVESEASEYVKGDPYGRRDYFQDGNRRGGQFGPGYYAEGYYYPRQQFPDYWYYDARRSGSDSVWTVVVDRAVKPFLPDEANRKFLRELAEDARGLVARDGWAGGKFDAPRGEALK